MKLGPLNSAIRALKGPPQSNIRIGNAETGVPLYNLEITKQSLLKAIAEAFPDGTRTTETHLCLEGNVLRHELSQYPAAPAPQVGDEDEPAVEPEPDGLEDLFG